MNSSGKRSLYTFQIEEAGEHGRGFSLSPAGFFTSLRYLTKWLVADVPVPFFYAASPDEYNKYTCTVLYPSLEKYYGQRYSLFSLYDSGILLDAESWYSVTPEKIAAHQASVLPPASLVIDACCGCGGNSIQFALAGHMVVSIEIDPMKIAMARNNARIYQVEEYIDFICADWMSLSGPFSRGRPDVLFISPPWGGPSYKDHHGSYDLDSLMGGIGLAAVLSIGRKFAPIVALFLPRNTCRDALLQAAKDSGALDLTIERNLLGKHMKGITAYVSFAL